MCGSFGVGRGDPWDVSDLDLRSCFKFVEKGGCKKSEGERTHGTRPAFWGPHNRMWRVGDSPQNLAGSLLWFPRLHRIQRMRARDPGGVAEGAEGSQAGKGCPCGLGESRVSSLGLWEGRNQLGC